MPMYRTNIPCRPAGRFRGPMVVSMRPMTPAQAVAADAGLRAGSRGPTARRSTSATRRRSASRDLARPDFGDAVTIRPGEVPVFWACGVTPQAVAMQAGRRFAITHKPGHMFLTDLKDADLEGE